MQKQFQVSAPDGRDITIYGKLPNSEPKAVMVISHGMAEHIQRYSWFAETLAQRGVGVFTANHRGHGADAELPGHYADEQGWTKVIDDLDLVIKTVKKNYPQPLILFGHSMGSFIARQYAVRYGELLSGLILSGSNHQPAFIFKAGGIVSKLERARLGGRKVSTLLGFLSFGSFNNQFKPNRTEFDWLSRDNDQVDAYINDPLCGFDCTTQFWCDFMQGLAGISDKSAFRRIDSKLPVFVISGDKDPVGRMGKGANALAAMLRNVSGCPTQIKLYPDSRHEILNEVNRSDVANDILHWLQSIIA